MRTINREIVGAFIFSKDDQVLLGFSRTYHGQLVIPGGVIEPGESKIAAARREMLEETEIDIAAVRIEPMQEVKSGESEAVPEDGEHIFTQMRFYDFAVYMPQDAAQITVHASDDFSSARWYTKDELRNALIGAPTRATLEKLKFL